VVTWHFVLLLPQWCLVWPLCGEATKHKEMWIQLKHFLTSDSKNLQKDFFVGLSFVSYFEFNLFSPTWSSNSQMLIPQFNLWACKGMLSSSSCFGTIFSCTHVFRHHLSFHHITPRIRWLFFVFPWRLWTKLGPQTFFWFLQVSVPMHATFIGKWSF